MMHKLTNGNYSATKVAANDAANGVHGDRFSPAQNILQVTMQQ